MDTVAKHERTLLLLPGAAGRGDFWKPVGDRLPATWQKVYLDLPGLGNVPAQDGIDGLDALYRLAERNLGPKTAIIAQSMGGILAVQLALRHPQRVSHLVLTATSGGVNMTALGGKNWRPDYAASYPNAAAWIMDQPPDLSARLKDIRAPTLLLWGDDDPVSPLAVGQHLAAHISGAQLKLVHGGTHTFANKMPEVVAPLILAHLMGGVSGD